MTVTEWLSQNPEWLSGQDRTRIRIKLPTGETPLLCADSFMGAKPDDLKTFMEHLSKAEFLRLEPF